MVDEFKLKRIPTYDYPNCDYETKKMMYNRTLNQFLKEGRTIVQCVNGLYYHHIDHRMNENGMDKFVAMIIGMLFMLEHNDVEVDQAYGTNLDIQDFETGEYDDLFTSEDLALIRADIAIIKAFLSQHPEMLVD